MKKTTKLASLAAGLLVLAGVTFTSCNPDLAASTAKDDFFGTWETLDFDADGNRTVSYQASSATRRIVWSFNGKAENIGDGGTFTQVSYNYGSKVPTETELKDLVPSRVTFLFGKYDITGNSDYTKGKYYMQYQIMIPLHDDGTNKGFISKYKPLADVENKKITLGTGTGTYDNDTINSIIKVMKGWELKDFLALAYGSDDGVQSLKDETATFIEASDKTHFLDKNGIMLQVKYTDDKKKLLCSDVEYFRFNLKEGTLSGYARMMITTLDKDGKTTIGRTYNQFVNNSTKLNDDNKIIDGCLWTGTDTRYMGRISVSSTSDNEPIWIGKSTKTNEQLFPLADTEDTDDYAPKEHDTSAEK